MRPWIFLEKSSSNRVTTLKKPKKNRVNSMQNPAIFVVYHHVSQTFAHKKLPNQMIGESNSRPPNWCNLWATWQAWFPSRILAKIKTWWGLERLTSSLMSRLDGSFSTTDWCSWHGAHVTMIAERASSAARLLNSCLFGPDFSWPIDYYQKNNADDLALQAFSRCYDIIKAQLIRQHTVTKLHF